MLSAELEITIDAQVEAPGHGKWWLDGKTGSDKRYCQQCMCAINTPGEETNNNKPMLSAKWIDSDGDVVAVSPAEECVRILNNQFRVNGIKSEGMHAKREGKALVECNDYNTYTMDDAPIIPDWKISFPKGKYNGIQAYFNIRTDPDMGVGWAALRRVACGCRSCKEQLKSHGCQVLKREGSHAMQKTRNAHSGGATRVQTIGRYFSLPRRQRTTERVRISLMYVFLTQLRRTYH